MSGRERLREAVRLANKATLTISLVLDSDAPAFMLKASSELLVAAGDLARGAIVEIEAELETMK